MKNHYIMRAISSIPWAILPDKLNEILAVLEAHESGISVTAEQLAAIKAAAPSRQVASAGKIAVMPLFGTITKRSNMFSEFSGGTSADTFRKDFTAAVNNSDIAGIILDIDSPGGSTWGLPELASAIREGRKQKPVYAVANSLAASAAYWIGSQASTFYATPGGDVGSIGVFAVHTDESGAEEKAGFKTTLISAGRFKTEGNSFEPLGDDAKAALQDRVDEAYGQFIADVAAGRGVSDDMVRAGYGEGRLLSAEKAMKSGMIDRIGTLDDAIRDMQQATSSKTITKAVVDNPTAEAGVSADDDKKRRNRLESERLRQTMLEALIPKQGD
jgi:signal peptide peptidase SppA